MDPAMGSYLPFGYFAGKSRFPCLPSREVRPPPPPAIFVRGTARALLPQHRAFAPRYGHYTQGTSAFDFRYGCGWERSLYDLQMRHRLDTTPNSMDMSFGAQPNINNQPHKHIQVVSAARLPSGHTPAIHHNTFHPNTGGYPYPNNHVNMDFYHQPRILERPTDWPALPMRSQESSKSIAEEKLKRQNERIESEQALTAGVLVKTKNRNKAKSWKALDITESSDEAASSDEQARSTPFSVHAKVFQPTPAAQMVSSEDARPSLNPYTDTTTTEREWQLAGRKPKPSVNALNARQIETDPTTATVAATFSKKEINEVFGNDLPSPGYCASNPGRVNGQLQFCMHPNGDVSAHQWSASHYQWDNIGQYSNIRKRTEGQLANVRLRGETERQSLYQNTLAYFRAKAKQREAEVMGQPFGPREIQACLSSLQSTNWAENVEAEEKRRIHEQQIASRASERRVSRPVDSYVTPPTMTRSNLTRTTSFPDSPTPPSHLRRMDSSASYGAFAGAAASTSSLTFGSMPSQNVNFGGHSRINGGVSGGLPRLLSRSDNNGQPTDVAMSPYDTRRGGHSEHGAMSGYRPMSENTGANLTPEQYLSMRRAQNKQSADAGLYQTSTQPSRTSMRDAMQKIAESATARGSSSVPQRTVLHDPLRETQAAPGAQVTASSTTDARASFGEPRESSNMATPNSAQKVRAPPGIPYPSMSQLPKDLLDSEPESDWRRRPVDVVNFRAPHMTNEELLLYSRPTPQNFNGPFFTDTVNLPSAVMDNRTHNEKLSDWYHAGTKRAERHEEYFQHVMARNRASVSSSSGTSASAVANAEALTPRHPGVIGRPSAAKNTPQKEKKEEPADKPVVNPITTRLLIPVLENLMSYAQDSKHKRRDHWTPWCDPPEYAIDRGPDGNKSMFDKEWEERYIGLVAERNKASQEGKEDPFPGWKGGYFK